MNAGKTIALEDVRRVAELASLELTAEEEPRMVRDLGAILGHVEQLNQLDITDVPPMAQVSEILSGRTQTSAVTGAEPLRADVLRPSLDRAVVMATAPETDGTHFKVPKVIER
jgi:aspartyl-tRNA(Asn)/glutamyl-tRNA(Gln) amidotransferase subunit C